ncbi:efflux RND transporter periplasmic adaptor subunit [Candidatus Margulisiibacteriota bacterium]
MNNHVKYYLIVIFLLSIITGCGKPKPPKSAPPKPVKTLQTVYKSFSTYRTISGLTHANQDITLSSEVSGQIDKVLFDLGHNVKKGDLLLKVNRQMAEAQLQSAKANLNLAQINYNSQKKLYRKKLISEQQFESSKTKLQVVKSQYKIASIHYKNTLIKSPVQGFVAEKYVEKGEFLVPAKPVMRIVNLDKIKVLINLASKELKHLKPKDIVSIMVPSLSSNGFKGIVNAIGVVAHNKSKTFPAEIIMSNPGKKIKAGMTCKVKFRNNYFPNVIVVPRDAIIEGKPKTVFIAQDNNIAVQKEISILAEEKGFAAIDGVSENVKLIVVGHKNVVTGEKIKIID